MTLAEHSLGIVSSPAAAPASHPSLPTPSVRVPSSLPSDERQSGRDQRAEEVRTLLAGLEDADEDRVEEIRRGVATLTLPVARSIASRYRNRGVDLVDLEQIAALGLMKAVHRWKPGLSDDFLQYAVPTISGEIKRFFRDRWWTVRPPRRLQEARAALTAAEQDLRQRDGREPEDAALAVEMGTDIATVREARQVRQSARFTSLEDPASDNGTIDRYLAADDLELDRVESRLDVAQMLESLGERERRVIELRYFRGLSQAKIGEAIGVSQMQVSRILRDVLGKLRDRWTE